MILVFKRLHQTHLGLRTAHQQVKLAILLQQRHNFTCATDMPVPCTLYGVKYLHVDECGGKLVKKSGVVAKVYNLDKGLGNFVPCVTIPSQMSKINKLYPFFLLFALILSACDWGRTPSKERFEKNCHITIPNEVTVIEDDYRGSGSDYSIFYVLKLTPNSSKDLTNSVIHSDYYNKYWYKSLRGYFFNKKVGNREFTEYSIQVDTISKIATFGEQAN